MSLSSRGCTAKIEQVIGKEDDKIIVHIVCTTPLVESGKTIKYVPDYLGEVRLMNHNNETVNKGDLIRIMSFYIKNTGTKANYHRITNRFDSIVITDWHIQKRNVYNKKYYKQQSNAEVLETKRRQRQAIEQEIEAEEQDIDEYIENIDENNPF
ncbi:MAG: hypothetical protein NC131_18465 [Roseburia sp.]|nr:hypothetical protein [Roseburia sp.]